MIPTRINFHVIYATSEVPNHQASELGWAGPASRGWRSSPGAHAPHDLVLQLASRVAITRVQLLAHHYLIPKKIELLVHDSSGGEGVARTPSSPQYEAVGWVGLGEGEGGARELRTASIPLRPAAYLRLRLSEPHTNEKNAFNQVALMGVNIFGIPITENNTIDKIKLSNDAKSECDVYSPFDDLSFIMYVDNDMADIIRQLEVKKQTAVIAERFEYARKLKMACDVLGTGGRIIGGWQLQKRVAAAAEQYERATRKRDAIMYGRLRISEAIHLEVLLEKNGVDPRNDEYSCDDKPLSIESLIQPPSHLHVDSPSPPTIMQSESLKNNTKAYDTYQFNEENKIKQNNKSYESNNHYHNNIEGESKLEENVVNEYNINNGYISEVDRTVSPFVNETLYVEKSIDNHDYYKENNNIGSTETLKEELLHNNGEKIGRIYFEENIHHLRHNEITCDVDNVSKKSGHNLENGKIKSDNYINEGNSDRLMDNSYFNSPANSISPTNMQYNADISRNGQGSPAASSRSSGQQKIMSSNSPVALQGANVVVKRRNRSAGPPPPAHHRSSYEAYEERLVPTLRHSHTNEYLRSYQTEQADQHKGRPKLGERERKQAALPILIFGEEMVEKIYSKHFVEKEEGLQCLKNELRSFDIKPPGGVGGAAALSPNKAARAVAFLLHRALRDPVFSVYSLAAELTRIFFTEFIRERVNAAEVGRSLERLVPELLTRAGDPAPRVHSLAMHTLLTMADSPPVRSLNVIPTYLVRPLTAGTAPRLALSRLLMVEQLLLNHGIDKNSGLKARAVAELGAGGITHGQGAVRRAAERLLLTAYERAPRLVRGQLPPDDPVTRRNLLYRHLFEGFDRIDRRKHEEATGPSNTTPVNTQFNVEKTSLMMESMTASQMTNSMSSSMGSSMMGSLYQPKSSLKKPVSKKYTSSVGFNGVKNDEYPGYNKLRLDSAVSPKHQPKIDKTAENPRNYVLEKNWQNRIQNGNFYTPSGNCPNDNTKFRINEITTDSMKNKNLMINSVTDLTSTNFNPIHKSSVVARNLHSSIIFDSKTSYSDSENTSVIENGVKELHMGENKITSSDTIKNDKTNGFMNGQNSPGGTLKKNKNIKNTIFRSKSGSNVPTCYNDNFDSFDDSHLEIYEYIHVENEILNEIENNKDNQNNENEESAENIAECPFCLMEVEEAALDIHYWRTCPLLCRCVGCRVPMEIRILSQHLTEECSHSHEYKRCLRCTEAIEIENYQRHLADDDCKETTEGFLKCPLCQSNVMADDDNWRKHLMGKEENSCTMNPRAYNK